MIESIVSISGDASVTVERLGRTADNECREEWGYTVTVGDESCAGADLRTGAQVTRSAVEMLHTLADFLDAYAESREGGENDGLFPISRYAASEAVDAIHQAIGFES